MSENTKLDPATPSAVVREVFPPPPPLAGWIGFYYDSGFYDSEQGKKEDAGWYCSGKVHPSREEALCDLSGFRPFEGSAIVEVGCALFAPAPGKVAKVETMADRIAADLKAGTFRGEQPAPPEPAKVEYRFCGQGCGAQVAFTNGITGPCPDCDKPAQPEPAAPVLYVCPSCNKQTATKEEHVSSRNRDSFTCQPAPPEPAAQVNGHTPIGEYDPDMKPAAQGEISELDDRHNRMASPEYQAKVKADMGRRAVEIGMERLVGVASIPVSEAVTVGSWQLEELLKYADLAEVALRTGFHPPEFLFTPADRSLRQCIDAIKKQRDEWRARSQPVAVGMTEELEDILEWMDVFVRDGKIVSDSLATALILKDKIAAVRQQAAQGKWKVELPKVREFIDFVRAYRERYQLQVPFSSLEMTMFKLADAALAELDAAEGRK